MLTWLWPVQTGKTFIDVWTLFHLAFWLFVGSVGWSFQAHVPRVTFLAVCLVLAYVWEAFERYAEPRWPHLWLSPESSINAYVSDPLTCVVGLVVAWYVLDNWR